MKAFEIPKNARVVQVDFDDEKVTFLPNLDAVQWRAESDCGYYTFNQYGVIKAIESSSSVDSARFENGWYFKTEEQATAAFEAIKIFLLKFNACYGR